MTEPRDWTGTRCNHLTIIGRGPTDTTKAPRERHSLWVGVCDCGKKRLVRSNELAKGRAKHCGDMRCPYRVGVHTRRAIRAIPIELTQAEAQELRNSPCRCCGNPPGKRGVLRLYKPDLGYTARNTFNLCEYCAGLLPEKRLNCRQLSWDNLVDHVLQILNHLSDTGDIMDLQDSSKSA